MRSLSRAYHLLLDSLSALAGVLILAIMLGVAADVLARYLVGRPIVWMFEVTEYALLYIPCLGMAWLAREGGHVAIDSFIMSCPSRVQAAAAIGWTTLCVLICAFVTWWGALVVIDRYTRGTVFDQMIRTPEYLVLWVIPFGFGLTTIEFTRLLVHRLRGHTSKIASQDVVS